MRFVAAIFIIFLSAGNIKSFADRVLSFRSVPVDPKEKRWDFSQCERVENGVTYRVYGDTLLAEVYDGVRQLYRFKGDSVLYLGAESKLMKLRPDRPLPTSAFWGEPSQSIITDSLNGMYCKTLALGQYGSYESTLPVEGIMITDSGYEIPVTAITERRRFTEWLASDSLAKSGETIHEYVKTRWFTEGDHLPIAYQVTEQLFYRGKHLKTESKSFIMASEDINLPDKVLDRIIQKSIDMAEIHIDNSLISISGTFPTALTLLLSITNIQGNSLHQVPLEMAEGENLKQVEIPSMPPGQYIMTISSGTPVSRKVVYHINQ